MPNCITVINVSGLVFRTSCSVIIIYLNLVFQVVYVLTSKADTDMLYNCMDIFLHLIVILIV